MVSAHLGKVPAARLWDGLVRKLDQRSLHAAESDAGQDTGSLDKSGSPVVFVSWSGRDARVASEARLRGPPRPRGRGVSRVGSGCT
jgi:hypothetical protein